AGQPYTVAILDAQLPGADGLGLARVIHADPALAETRLMLLTTFGPGARDEEEAAGIAATLTKPVRQSRLLATLARVAGERGDAALPPHADPAPRTKDGTGEFADDDLQTAAPRILVVDDSPLNQEVALAILARLGCRGDTAGGGPKALVALARAEYDAVLMDCQMPGMDGLATSAEIRRCEGPGRHTPIIALTANAMARDRERCLAAGMDDYLAKPVRMAELAAA